MIGVIIFLVLSVFLRPLQCLSDLDLDQKVPCGKPRKYIVALIRGGKTADAQEHPWHSSLFHWNGTNWEYQCGGTLISNKFVLTARHCTMLSGVERQISTIDLLVKLGLQELNHENLYTQSYNASAIYTVEDNPMVNFRNDIALIKLNGKVQFSDHILPACLVSWDVIVNETGTVVGFGMTENGTLSNSLRMLRVPVVHPFLCLRMHKELVYRVNENQFCAGYTDGRTVCNGDSGGGLLFRRNGTMQLGGIVSFTAARGLFDYRCKEKGYAVYTNVFSYLPWIELVTTGIENQTSKIGVEKPNYQQCGIPSTKSSMIISIYKNWDIEGWTKICDGAVISQRDVLGIGCDFKEYNILQVALSSFHYNTNIQFSKIYHQRIAFYVVHPTFENIVLFRLERDLVFNESTFGAVQPICLPTLEEYETNDFRHLINYHDYYSSPKFEELPRHNKTLQTCEPCLNFEIPINDTNVFCLENSINNSFGPFLGFFASRNGTKQFVLYGARLHFCWANVAIFYKFDFKDHIQWINENVKQK